MTSRKVKAPPLEDVLTFYGVDDGSRRIISCPLHEDRTPSCSVDHGAGLWNCFSCSEGGDAWTLIMLREGISFSEAVEFAETNKFQVKEAIADERTTGSIFGGQRRSARKGDRPNPRRYRPSWRR